MTAASQPEADTTDALRRKVEQLEREVEILKAVALCDSETGLLNRRGIERAYSRENGATVEALRVVNRYDHSVRFAVLRISTCAVGNGECKEMAAAITKCVKDGRDIVGTTTPGEFIVIIPGIDDSLVFHKSMAILGELPGAAFIGIGYGRFGDPEALQSAEIIALKSLEKTSDTRRVIVGA